MNIINGHDKGCNIVPLNTTAQIITFCPHADTILYYSKQALFVTQRNVMYYVNRKSN